VIGRGVECDLKIDDATLSRRHAELSVNGEALQVRDLASANGVFVNEERIDQAELHAGDRLRLGARSFLVVGPERLDPRQAADATVVHGRAAATHTEILGAAAGSARLEEQTGYLAQGALSLRNSRYRLGRDAGNDVVIGDSSISRVHALLIAVGGDWQVQDMQSSNGVLVNGERIESATLRDGDEIRLGRAVFLYRAN
jgi:pSer/pThr/pTyr-binding forkhead associated (FHA) protein